jgi:hypothetical protein
LQRVTATNIADRLAADLIERRMAAPVVAQASALAG